MHIPNSMLHGQICPVTAAVSLTGIIGAVVAATCSKKHPNISKFSAVTALIFAGQMMNFPINNGTSGHLIGGVLAASLLGIPFGILSMVLVITIQCLIFADGGLNVLGANILNMAFITAGVGGGIYRFLIRKFKNNPFQSNMVLGFSSWLSVVLAALCCSIELAISGTIPFSKVAGAMLNVHVFIGLGEGLITIGLYNLLVDKGETVVREKTAVIPLLGSFVIALILSPFASNLPDGLEWVAEKFNFLHNSAPTFVSPLADYIFPGIRNELLAKSLAGFVGVAITFLVAWITAKLYSKYFVKAKNL